MDPRGEAGGCPVHVEGGSQPLRAVLVEILDPSDGFSPATLERGACYEHQLRDEIASESLDLPVQIAEAVERLTVGKPAFSLGDRTGLQVIADRRVADRQTWCIA